MPGKGRPFKKGEGGRPKGSKNRVTKAVLQTVLASRRQPLDVMLDIQSYHHQRWLDATNERGRQHHATMALEFAKAAAPYVHARMVVLETDQPLNVTINDRRHGEQIEQVTNGHAANGHGPNGHGPNGGGSNGGSAPNAALN
jgi:hypothetical protein